jgi:two-component system alkaline phosphatase synthesis response regulator PhoP
MKPKPKILFVEDDPRYSDLYNDYLKLKGFDVLQVFQGEKVMEKLKEFKPDLILLDLMLPKMRGEEVLDLLEKDEEARKIPVIILTAYIYDEEQKIKLKARVDDYIIKTELTPREIVKRINKILDR